MLRIENLVFNPFQENTFVIWDETKECAICDPGCMDEGERKRLEDVIAREGLTPKAVLLTHGHADHTYGAGFCAKKYGATVYMREVDRHISLLHSQFVTRIGMPELDVDFDITAIREEDVIKVGSHVFTVIETPGHTPGGACFLCIAEKLLLSGDTLFRGTIGRTDLDEGNYDDLMRSITGKLLGLAGDIDVLPGHGPSTTIAEEVQNNPFLAPFNEEIDEEQARGNAIEPTIKDE